MFGIETRTWSLTTSSSAVAAERLLATTPEPDRRTWLAPGPLAPVCRVRTDGRGTWLRLSPGDVRRGPGSADRLYVVAHDGRVDCAQRPGAVGRIVVGGFFVVAWAVAALAAAYGVATTQLGFLVGVPLVLAFRSVAEVGRRLDARRYRRWLRQRLTAAAPVTTTARPVIGPAIWTVPDGDCR